MGSYGRNFDFRIPPDGDERFGRFCVPAAGSRIPQGAPLKSDYTAGVNTLGLQLVELATGEQAPPKAGAGILVYEFAPAAFAGLDAQLVTYSDLDRAPLSAAVQVVHHPGVKVVFANTANSAYFDFSPTFQSGPRIMIAGLGATPSIHAGDLLSPGQGNDTDGYYIKTSTAANAWFIVTKVDAARQEVEAEMLF